MDIKDIDAFIISAFATIYASSNQNKLLAEEREAAIINTATIVQCFIASLKNKDYLKHLKSVANDLRKAHQENVRGNKSES